MQSSIADVVQHDVVHRRVEISGVESQPGRGIPLRVEIDHQHPVAEIRRGGAEVDRRGRLADAALLVGHRDHPGQIAAKVARRVVGFDLGGRWLGLVHGHQRFGNLRRCCLGFRLLRHSRFGGLDGLDGRRSWTRDALGLRFGTLDLRRRLWRPEAFEDGTAARNEIRGRVAHCCA
jgi:hypothetical protein